MATTVIDVVTSTTTTAAPSFSKANQRVTFAEIKPVDLSVLLSSKRKPAKAAASITVTEIAPVDGCSRNKGSKLLPNDTLTTEHYLSSPSGKYRCQFNEAGVLTIAGQRDGSVRQVAPRISRSACSLVLRGDGNLVMEDANCRDVWSSRTSLAQRAEGLALVMQDDGFLVLYADQTPLWASGKDFWRSWSPM